MKKIILCLVFLVTVPSVTFGGNAAPYTEDALQNIFKALHDTPKDELADNSSKEEFHKRFIDYYSTVFEKAGYSFNDTIDKIVDDMKNNPEAIPADRQTVYNKVYILLNVMMYECSANKVDCLQFFPQTTQQSIQWFVENSEFSKQDVTKHHLAK